MLEQWTKDQFTEIGDACKRREEELRGVTTIAPSESFVIRVDGRAFHTFTKGLLRPFSPVMKKCMNAAAQEVVKQLGAKFAYFQSDEISYVWKGSAAEDYGHPYKGRVEKLLSIVSAITSVAFYKEAIEQIDDLDQRPLPVFDARLAEIAETQNNLNHDAALMTSVMWRENDALRNSIAMVAQSYYTQAELQGKNTSEQQLMCTIKGFDWDSAKVTGTLQGTYLVKKKQMITLTETELARIPEDRRPDPGQTFARKAIVARAFTGWDMKQRVDYLLGETE